ncbi:MAG TPA: 2-succinyl-5-enolpyruvyl-6-hydroxy-3-cyclohexene-1-carboxylic-acid synthase, partial [Anaerolineales bacterium]|nr:2-succinyl-5-enolpyruvyl-6-hydroxy-3-cyclohexene-1-carboxylic-acid synthase [Anaerolineales bacterium]
MDSERNTLWATIFVDELARSGLRSVCIAPGSRSTPLALAFAGHSAIEVQFLIDERSAAFFALGKALGNGLPAAVLCTSGTAVANLLPAVLEARHSRVPLILLTADRPPELRQAGANQTIDQLKIFSGGVKWFAEAALPEEIPSPLTLRYLRDLACRAYGFSLQSPRGPVHLNFPFRKPLEPETVDHDMESTGDGRPLEFAGRPDGEPWTTVYLGTRGPAADSASLLADLIRKNRRGLIVAGSKAEAGNYIDPLKALAIESGYPVLADPLSGARFSPMADSDAIICGGYDWYLRTPGLEAELVLRFGSLPTSSALEHSLESQTAAIQVGFFDGFDWPDPTHQLSFAFDSEPARTCELIVEHLRTEDPPQADRVWLDSFAAREALTWNTVTECLEEEYCEAGLAADLVSLLPEDSVIFSASSLPIRHLDRFARPMNKRLHIFSNRGVSGIDGTLSSAAGVASSFSRPLVILIGDLAFHHDQTGLLALQKYGLGSTVILINNKGGGIFHQLPIARFEPPFNELFRTPIKVDLKPLVQSYGGRHEAVSGRGEFLAVLSRKQIDDPFLVIEYQSEITQFER